MNKFKFKVDNFAVSVVIFIVCITLICVMLIQFKTVEETDITEIENMREAELRTAISEWKFKYEETYAQLEQTYSTIKEYNERMEKNEETSELIDKELEQSRLAVGKTDVVGEGVIVTLRDNDERDIIAYDLIDLINELRYAGAEAISINDIRIVNTTDIVDLDNYSYINVGGRRLESPYVVKAIGNQTYLSSILNLKNSGFVDRYRNSDKTIEFEQSKKIQILKHNGDMNAEYMKDKEENE